MRHTLLLLTLIPLFLHGQHNTNSLSFQETYAQSLTLHTTPDTILCGEPIKETAALLLAKENWKAIELDTLDCILSKLDRENQPELDAIFTYITAKAYRDFDDAVFDNLIQEAYFLFEQIGDKSGMFFSQSSIISSVAFTTEGINTAHNVAQLYAEAESLANEMVFVPAKIKWIELMLGKMIFDKIEVDTNQLDSIYNFVSGYENDYPSLVRLIYTDLAINYQSMGNHQQSLFYKKKALALANTSNSDYPSFLTNIGGSFFYLGQLDSAKYYLLSAFQKVDNSNTIYLIYLKSNIAQKLSVVYKRLNQPDSARHFELTSLRLMIEKLNLERDEKHVYSAKKFEVKKLELSKAKLDLALALKEKQRLYLIFGIASIGLIAIVFTFLFFRYKRLKEQKSDLADNRGKLLHIIGHDLSSPLKALATSAEVLPILIETKKFDDVARLQKALAISIEGLQNTIANLFWWNQNQLDNPANHPKECIYLDEFFESLLANYDVMCTALKRKVNLNIPEDAEITCEVMYFSQLMRNLVHNAIKHGAEGSFINIDATTKNQDTTITVSNTFVEESAEDVKLLVKAYSRSDISLINQPGLGSELIFESIKKLNWKFSASIIDNKFEVLLVAENGAKGI